MSNVYKNAPQFETITYLKLAITDSWENITGEDRKLLVDSMEQRILSRIMEVQLTINQ